MNHSGNKYLRSIKLTEDGRVDVYAVLEAFEVTSQPIGHAIKKLLCAGVRGKGDRRQDISEARDALTRALELESTPAANGLAQS